MASPLLRTYSLFRRHLPLLAAVVALSLAGNAVMALHNHGFGLAIDAVKDGTAVVQQPDGSLATAGAWTWVWVLLGIAACRGLIVFLLMVTNSVLAQRIAWDLRDRLFGAVQALDLEFHRIHGTGELITRTTRDCEKIREALASANRMLIDLAFGMASVIILLACYHPGLSLVPLILLTVSLAAIWLQADGLVKRRRAAGDSYDRVTQEITEVVVGVRVVKAFALEAHRLDTFRGLIAHYIYNGRRSLVYAATRLPPAQLLLAFGHAWIAWYGAELVIRGEITVGEVLASLMAMTSLVFRTDTVAQMTRIFAEARSSAARVWEILDARPAVTDGDGPVPAGPLGFRLEGVGVGGAAPILTELDLTIAPGEVVALVGATGSGKTTLTSLLPRLRDPDQGRVLIGNDAGWVDARTCRMGVLRHQVQTVFQGSFLFSASVADNLRMNAPAATDEELWLALAVAGIDDFVRDSTDGLDAEIGERGLTLSGGQRQRMCLARALLARPTAIILDDATSALDAATERRVLDGLRTGTAGATVFIVASRLSSILLADRVLLLDAGHIVASGSHVDLARNNAHYREMLCLDEEARDA